MSSSSSTSEFINNANEALVFILDISENFPIIGQVASLCKVIYEKADTASSNKDNCKKAAKRCRAVQIIIAQCAKDFQRNNSINKKTRSGGYGTPLDKAYDYNKSPIKQKIIDLIRSKGGKTNYYDADGRFVGIGNGDLNH